ncbi:HCNGP-like protein [Rhizoctonia solani]|uniref:HCNGP-like protein n=1 Tax=Rhizoctonia solani TaxID=456999 RepID=A0A8H7ILT7_9AGAM|nr:HCNGP-like protein [Rhizoctonia solani]
MQSIIGYSDDDRSDDEVKRSSPTKPRQEPRDLEGTDSSTGSKQAVRGGKKPRIDPTIIRRTIAQAVKPPQEQREAQPNEPPRLQDLSLEPTNDPKQAGADDLTQIRALLRPPPIAGVENYGIPPPSEDPVDAELAAKISKFLALKKQGTHFNDILMKNKSFNNPHIYAKLVDFVEVDETGTNFPKNVWNPHDIQPECYSAEETQCRGGRAQAPGKRSRIAFDSASSSSTSSVHPSVLQKGNRHSDEKRGRHSDESRSRRSDGGSKRKDDDRHGGQRYHPYQYKPDANMGWVPRNHSAGDRPRRW